MRANLPNLVHVPRAKHGRRTLRQKICRLIWQAATFALCLAAAGFIFFVTFTPALPIRIPVIEPRPAPQPEPHDRKSTLGDNL